jgi:hypothetical protein
MPQPLAPALQASRRYLLRRLSICLAPLIFIGSEIDAAVYQVGPGRSYATLQEVTSLVRLQPGDVVTVDGGGMKYSGGVTLRANGAPGSGVISIIGIPVDRVRPILSGVTTQGEAVLRVLGNHYLIAGFDLTAGGDPRAARCFYNVGDDVTLRDSLVHDCDFTGIAGSDASGSLTLERVEVCRCGKGLYAHQIYVGSSLATYPDALFRMRFCYLHDGAGGNNVKSRVTRNDIEYNWIEGAFYHELDLVGPDPKAQKMPPGVHCDADVIGNVLVKTAASQGTVARLGSDGTASSRGRYRFAYNTVIVRARKSAGFGLFWLEGQVDSVGLWNNVFWSEAGPLNMMRRESATPPAFEGNGNWLPEGTTDVPQAWKAIRGRDPKFLNPAREDYRPAAGSPLIGAGCLPPAGMAAISLPPGPKTPALETPRPAGRKKDIGAYPMTAPSAKAK